MSAPRQETEAEREERIHRLREQIERGEYKVDSQELGKRIVAAHIHKPDADASGNRKS